METIDELKQQLSDSQARECAVREAAKALVDRMNEIEDLPEYERVWELAYLHGESYAGPTWEAERDALAKLLSADKVSCLHQQEAERLAVAFDSDAFRAIEGAVYPREALNIDGIVAAHDSHVRAETLKEAKYIAVGCKDYGGGYRSEPRDLEIFHHGMDTVARVIQAQIDDPNDTQSLAVLAIGRNAERGEWPEKG